MHGAGASVSGIARHLDLDRKTVRCWLRRDEPPNWAKPARPRLIDPYRPYLDQRWSEGCRNAAALARELDRLGARINLGRPSSSSEAAGGTPGPGPPTPPHEVTENQASALVDRTG